MLTDAENMLPRSASPLRFATPAKLRASLRGGCREASTRVEFNTDADTTTESVILCGAVIPPQRWSVPAVVIWAVSAEDQGSFELPSGKRLKERLLEATARQSPMQINEEARLYTYDFVL